MFEVDIKGIKETQDRLDEIIKTTEELEKGKTVPINELMTNDFVKKHTKHNSFEEYLFESKLVTRENQITEEILNSKEFDEYVKNTTSFSSWREMLEKASVGHIQRQLGF